MRAFIVQIKNFYDLDEDYINNAIDLNLKAPILLIHKMMGFLNGVININSMSGLENKKLRTIYASSKWGLKGFSECLKKEDLDLKILDVYPSSIKTNVNITYGMDPEMLLNLFIRLIIKIKLN